MRIKIYQINHEKDTNRVRFFDLNRTTEISGKVDPSIYKTVFDGEVDCKSWGEIFSLFNSSKIPFTHQGHSLSVSDVVEVIDAPMLVGEIKFYVSDEMYQVVSYVDEATYKRDIAEARQSERKIKTTWLKEYNIPSIEPGTYFCDLQDFKIIDFDNSSVAPMEGNRMLIVEPHKAPYEAIVKDDFRAVQKIVGGTFECVYPFYDDAFMFVNDEGKLIGLEGNRMVDGDIIAGNILIASDDGRGRTKSLTNEQIARYKKQFENDEAYTQDEVESSANMFFIELN